jgi:peroxiredoxin
MNALHRVSKKGLKTTGMQGKRVSDSSLAATGATQFTLSAHRGLVLYSHPKFPFGSDGVLAREWRGVKVPGHAQEVSNFVKAL